MWLFSCEHFDSVIGTAAAAVQAALAEAMAACARRRGELEVDAIVKSHADAIDVFLGADPNVGRARSLTDRPSGDFARPTEKQRAALERAGVTLSLSVAA
jgi:hypothetical protein